MAKIVNLFLKNFGKYLILGIKHDMFSCIDLKYKMMLNHL